MSATAHLDKARDYIARGEDYYRRAADEIVAAMADDPTLGYGRVATTLGKSEKWCRQIVQWSTNPEGPPSPFGGEQENQARYERHEKTILTDPERRQRALSHLDASTRAELAKEILRDHTVTEIAHDDTEFAAAVSGASSRIQAKQSDATDARRRVRDGLDADELSFEKVKQAVREGRYGDAERLLASVAIDDERAAWLRKQADRHRYLADWFDAWADARPLTDDDLTELLGGI
jgi:hypothetical protein